MPATLLGEVGRWGIPSSEVAIGIIIKDISYTDKKKSKEVINNQGDRVGRSDYDRSKEIKISGEMTYEDGFSQSVSGDLVMANAIGIGSLGTSESGRTIIDEVSGKKTSEDFETIEVSAEMLPNMGVDIV